MKNKLKSFIIIFFAIIILDFSNVSATFLDDENIEEIPKPDFKVEVITKEKIINQNEFNLMSNDIQDNIVTEKGYIETEGYIPENIEIADSNSQISPFTIFGDDDRTFISSSNISKFPYTAIGYLEVTLEDGSVRRGTGMLIGKNIVLTAGHMLYDGEHKKRLNMYCFVQEL